MRTRFRNRTRLRGEAGISLIELLIAISVTGIILAPIGLGIFFGFRTTGETQTRVEQSNGANLMASYFVPDVQGAVAVAKNASDALSCGASAGTASLVVTTLASPATTVSYYRGTGANAHVLYRRTCSNGAVTGVARVLGNLATDPAYPAFTCDLATDCSAFRSVSVSLLQQDSSGRNNYQTRLTAAKRGT
jgi:hypothetical protein